MGSRAAETYILSSTFTHLFISCERAFLVGDNIGLEQVGIVFHRVCRDGGMPWAESEGLRGEIRICDDAIRIIWEPFGYRRMLG